MRFLEFCYDIIVRLLYSRVDYIDIRTFIEKDLYAPFEQESLFQVLNPFINFENLQVFIGVFH